MAKKTKKTARKAKRAKPSTRAKVAKRTKPSTRAKVAKRTKPSTRAKVAKRTKPSTRAKIAKRAKPARTRARKSAPSRKRPPPHIPLGPTELDTIKLAYLFRNVSPAAVYRALLDPQVHSAFTGDAAKIDARVGGSFRAYHGFISGRIVELVPDARIVQSWRTNHFPKNNPDSRLELTFTPIPGGTRLDMRHMDVPKDQLRFLADGWIEHYWGPLARYLAAQSPKPDSRPGGG